MDQVEIRVSGFGGQGIILAGYIIGKAAAIYGGRQATMAQAYGPEARGSACSSQVIISDHPIRNPYVTRVQVLVAMSQEAYDKFAGELTADGALLIDETLVTPNGRGPNAQRIPATRLAEDLGRKIVANIVMLGFFTATTGVLDRQAMREAVATSVPKAAIDLNLRAFDLGYDYRSGQPVADLVEELSAG